MTRPVAYSSKVIEETKTIGPTCSSSSSTILFTDPVYETASSIRYFLHVAKWWRFPPSICLDLESDFNKIHNFAMFLKKYECEKPLLVLCDTLCKAIPSATPSHRRRVFVLACRLGKTDLATAALGNSDAKAPCLLGYFCSQMTREEHQSLPEEYKWALLHAVSLQAELGKSQVSRINRIFKECLLGNPLVRRHSQEPQRREGLKKWKVWGGVGPRPAKSPRV